MKSDRTPPFLSVIICSFNGGPTIGRTIESLLSQDYPHSRFEIIVVNDGSNDNTAEVCRDYPVYLHTLERNSGISVARNAGLELARGEIFVGIDDDCVAYPDLLSQLAGGYSEGDPAGVGGYIADPEAISTITEHYIAACGNGSTPVSHHISHTPFGRVLAFLQSKIHNLTGNLAARFEVTELYGANGSFPVEVLRSVGGWDAGMSGIEDRDLSRRIKQRYPDRPFYAMRDAKLIHDPDCTLWQYLLRPYHRGPMNLKFYQRNAQLPPIFPFPLVLLLVVVIAFVSGYLPLIPAVLLIFPQLMNFWWPYRAIVERRALFLLFPYIELTEEAMVIAGLMRGYAGQLRGRYARA